tara:strand:- start:360 stop:515 length:156 start_codon:yes stop_codon:yes gene_type:complete
MKLKKYLIKRKFGKNRYYILSNHSIHTIRKIIGKGFKVKEMNGNGRRYGYF